MHLFHCRRYAYAVNAYAMFAAVMNKSQLDFYRRMVYSGLLFVSNNDMSHFPVVFHEEFFWVATTANAMIKSPEVR